MKEFKEGDRIINCCPKHANGMWNGKKIHKGQTYTFHKYWDESKYYLQAKECLMASPNHHLESDIFVRFNWWRYIAFNIEQQYWRWKYKDMLKIWAVTVSEYCQWKPFKKVVDAPTQYYSELAKLDTYK